jgi:hypothetical protein
MRAFTQVFSLDLSQSRSTLKKEVAYVYLILSRLKTKETAVKHMTAEALQKTENLLSAASVPRALSVHQKRIIFTRALERDGLVGAPLNRWDKLKAGEERDSATTDGTILSAGVAALKEAGVRMNDTMGDVKRELASTDDELHSVGCHCFERAAVMSGKVAAARLRSKFGMIP